MRIQYTILADRYKKIQLENKKLLNENLKLLKENKKTKNQNKELLLLLDVKVGRKMSELEHKQLEDELYERIFELKDKLSKLEEENEDLKDEINFLNEKYEQREKYIEDNYKKIGEMEMYGLRESNFH